MSDRDQSVRQRAQDSQWVVCALTLAERGEALASPNPLVGAVLVKDGRIVGQGFHTYAARKHAEILALEKAGAAARGATLYVNLEPCCHTGRTAPCTRAIIRAGVGRVVAAMADPNPQVSGRGFRELRRAGIKVLTGLHLDLARKQNEAFAKWIRTGRPFVTLKSALTLDGQIASPSRAEKWITSEASRRQVQRLRHASDAILTGIGTVLADNPRLTDRRGTPRRRPLLRVVLDSDLRLPLRSKLVSSAKGDVLVFTTPHADRSRESALRRAGVEVVRVPARKGKPYLRAVMDELGEREILSVLLESGATLNHAALAAGIVDKVVLFFAPKFLGSTGVPFLRTGFSSLQEAPTLRVERWHFYGDFMLEGYLHDVYRNR